MLFKQVFALARFLPSAHFRRSCFTLKNAKPSYSYGSGTVHLTPATVGQVLDQTVQEAGDQTAFVFPGQGISRTYYEFHNEVEKLASGLLALGLKRGDRVALCAPSVYEWPVTQFAAAKAGLILVCINPASQAKEMEYFLNKVGCKALIVSETFKTQDFYKILCSFIPELSNCKPGSLSSQVVQHLQSVIFLNESNSSHKSGTFHFDDVMNIGTAETKSTLIETQKLIQFDDPVNILFTSGTTGNPKGAVLSHHNIVNNAIIVGKKLNHHKQQKTVLCLQLPFFHCFGSVIGLLGSVVYQNICVVPSPGFDAKASIQAMEKYSCTSAYGAPTMLIEIMNNYDPKREDLSCLKQVVIGGAASTESLLRGLHDSLNVKEIHNGYGTTETSPAIATVLEPFPPTVDTMSYMVPVDFVEVKIVDNKGHTVPVGSLGEVCARGHIVFLGYWDKEGYTKAVDGANWYHTGDLGKMDDKGRIRLTGRIKDMVIRGGENLYPVEIENSLNAHSSVLEVHICGVPDIKMGEELCAWVKAKNGESLTEEELKDFLKGKISHFKIPRYILFVEDFPKTGSGKIQKFKMTEISKEMLKL